jgi:hypothetical protein
MFARLSIGAVSCFLAVGTFGEVLIWSDKTNTAVDTTVVSHRPKSSKGSNPLLGHFKGIMTGIWESLSESAEGTIR